MKRLLISENEKKEILIKHGLIKEGAEAPICSSSGCSGKYTGPQFVRKSDGGCDDIAHQYSNVITKAVAAKLKELYDSGTYSKVNLAGITMTTSSVVYGCNFNQTTYTVNIPFVQVQNKCDARTGFAHVGGWGWETDQLNTRLVQLYDDSKVDPNDPNNKIRTNPVVGTINDMEYEKKTTPEGLVEYWIQWKHSSRQSDCGTQTQQKSPNVKNDVVISSQTLLGLRTDLAAKTENISIDLKSVIPNFNRGNYSISFSPGSTKIKKISLIFDNISSQNLDNRMKEIDRVNNLKRITVGKTEDRDGSPLWYALSYIPS